MFRQTKNIDLAFRQMRLFTVIIIFICTCITGYALYSTHELQLSSANRIYILANGKVLDAYAAERKDNIPVEARDHVKMFHFHFFSLDPDDKVIQANITKALYLADRSA